MRLVGLLLEAKGEAGSQATVINKKERGYEFTQTNSKTRGRALCGDGVVLRHRPRVLPGEVRRAGRCRGHSSPDRIRSAALPALDRHGSGGGGLCHLSGDDAVSIVQGR